MIAKLNSIPTQPREGRLTGGLTGGGVKYSRDQQNLSTFFYDFNAVLSQESISNALDGYNFVCSL